MIEFIKPYLRYSLWGNTVEDYLIALGVFIISIIAIKIFKHIVVKKLKEITKKTTTKIDDLIVKILGDLGKPFYGVIALYIALKYLTVAPIIDRIMYIAVLVVVTFYAVLGIQKLITFGTHKLVLKSQKEDKEIDPATIELPSKIANATLWVIAIVLIMSNLGYNVSALLAGLGIGGIAIAFALQNVLSDIFASFSIYLDRPFEIGDFVIIGDDMGVIKKIGIKSTRIQALKGNEIVVSNKELTSTRIHNYKKMTKRRIAFGFGVIYNTKTAKLKKIPEIVKKIIAKESNAEIDRVHFKEFGNFSLNYEVIYYMKTSEYNKYMDTQQSINFALKDKFEKEKIEFAYPTQTVLVGKA